MGGERGKELYSTLESTGGAERKASHIPKGSHSSSRFHKTPTVFKNEISLFPLSKRHTLYKSTERESLILKHT